MSKQTAELLEAFEALAPDEKRIFTAEFLRRDVQSVHPREHTTSARRLSSRNAEADQEHVPGRVAANAVVLAKLAKEYGTPIVLITSQEDHIQGPLYGWGPFHVIRIVAAIAGLSLLVAGAIF